MIATLITPATARTPAGVRREFLESSEARHVRPSDVLSVTPDPATAGWWIIEYRAPVVDGGRHD